MHSTAVTTITGGKMTNRNVERIYQTLFTNKNNDVLWLFSLKNPAIFLTNQCVGVR